MLFTRVQKSLSLSLFALLTFSVVGCSHHGHHGDHDHGAMNEGMECKAGCKMHDKHGLQGKHDMGAMSDMHSSAVTKGQFADVDYTFRSNTYFAGALTEKAVEAAQKADVKVVINLQEPSEAKWNEKEKIEKLGMKYYNFPVSSKGETFDTATFKNIEETYMKHHKAGDKVVVHCGSGVRASAWFAYHLNKTHGDTVEASIDGAKAVGLSKKTEEKVLKTLKK